MYNMESLKISTEDPPKQKTELGELANDWVDGIHPAYIQTRQTAKQANQALSQQPWRDWQKYK